MAVTLSEQEIASIAADHERARVTATSIDPVSRAQRIEHSPQFVDGSTRVFDSSDVKRRVRVQLGEHFVDPSVGRGGD